MSSLLGYPLPTLAQPPGVVDLKSMATLPPTLQTLSPNHCPMWGVPLEVFISSIKTYF